MNCPVKAWLTISKICWRASGEKTETWNLAIISEIASKIFPRVSGVAWRESQQISRRNSATFPTTSGGISCSIDVIPETMWIIPFETANFRSPSIVVINEL